MNKYLEKISAFKLGVSGSTIFKKTPGVGAIANSNRPANKLKLQQYGKAKVIGKLNDWGKK